jgi:hypothetical protein
MPNLIFMAKEMICKVLLRAVLRKVQMERAARLRTARL